MDSHDILAPSMDVFYTDIGISPDFSFSFMFYEPNLFK